MCWTMQRSQGVQGTVYSGHSADPVPLDIELWALSPRLRRHGPGALKGDRVQRWGLLVRLLDSHYSASNMCPDRVLKGRRKGSAPTEVQDLGGVVPDAPRSAAETVSQLCLDSWEKSVSDPWVLSMVRTGYRIQFQGRPPPFAGVHMTVVKDPVQAQVLAAEIATLLQKEAIVKVDSSEQHAGFTPNTF